MDEEAASAVSSVKGQRYGGSMAAQPIYGKPISGLPTCPIAQVSRASTTSRR